MNSIFWLTNALLETGFQVENEIVTGTKTACFHLLIKNGKVAQIIPASEAITDDWPQKDAKHLLVLPSFIERHCHLDKTLLGDEWRAVKPVDNIFERFEIEKEVLPALETTIQSRAEQLLGIYLTTGVTHVRTHVDVYPEVGLGNLEQVQAALQTYEGKLSHETVAFAQHGFLRSNSKELVRQALRKGANFVGGVDPATVDGDIEASLRAMVDLAATENAGIDLHLHDPGHLGIYTMQRLAELTKEAGLQGKVAISHAFGLGDISRSEAEKVAEQLADAGIMIISNIPIDRVFPPVDVLTQKGVKVAIGCDNIFDLWSPFGNGDVLERANRLAEISKWVNEPQLAQTLQFITDGQTPLNQEGDQIWPQVGDEASFVLVEASCSAEVIARRSKRVVTIFEGDIVSGSL